MSCPANSLPNSARLFVGGGVACYTVQGGNSRLQDRRITYWVYAKGWRIEVKCPLHRSPVNQRTAGTGAEEHRSSTEFGMGRSDSVGTENNPPKVADADPEQEKKYHTCGRPITTGGTSPTKDMASYLARNAMVEEAKPCDNPAVLAFRNRSRR